MSHRNFWILRRKFAKKFLAERPRYGLLKSHTRKVRVRRIRGRYYQLGLLPRNFEQLSWYKAQPVYSGTIQVEIQRLPPEFGIDPGLELSAVERVSGRPLDARIR